MTNAELNKFLRREKYLHIKHKIRMLIPVCIIRGWENLCYWLNPRQKWLTKKIPNSWVDKDYLLEICILEGIKHAVEEDNVLGGWDEDWRESFKKSQADPEYPEHQKEFDRQMKDVYEHVTQTLPELEKQLKDAWAKVPHIDFKDLNKPNKRSYEETYGEIDRLDGEISYLKTVIMTWAVTNRESIWT